MGARFFHQPVLNIQVYTDECPFSYTFQWQDLHQFKISSFKEKARAIQTKSYGNQIHKKCWQEKLVVSNIFH